MKNGFKILLIAFLLLFTGGLETVSAQDSPAAEPHAAIWATEAEGFQPDLTYPALYTLAYQGIGIAWLQSLDRNTTNFETPAFRNFDEALRDGPRFDEDDGHWNHVAHPTWGSETYLRARSQGYGRLGSFLFSTASSCAWEYAFESWYQRPSYQDLFITSTAGSLIGEFRFMLKRFLLDDGRDTALLLARLTDPLQSLTEGLGFLLGVDWREPAYQKIALSGEQHVSPAAISLSPIYLDRRVALMVRFDLPF